MKNEENFEKQLKSQILNEEFLRLDEQIKELETKKRELELVIETISELKNKKNNEILLPIGTGVFLKGKIEDDSSLLVSVGNNIVVKKSLDEVKKLIKNEMINIDNVKEELNERLNEIVLQFKNL